MWVFDLKGNQRTQGEISKKEGGKIFGSGSRAPVAITILVKNPKKKIHKILYYDLGDYHSREKKLAIIKDFGSIKNITNWQKITPDKHYDWLEHRISEFEKHMPIGSKDAKKNKKNATFRLYSGGVKTHRDVWAYNSSEEELSKNMKTHIKYCVEHIKKLPNPIDPRRGKWDGELFKKLQRFGKPTFNKSNIRISLFRPFFKQLLYFDRIFNPRQGIIPIIFPKNNTKNLVLCVPKGGKPGMFSAFITNIPPDISILEQSQCFPLYIYENGTKKRQYHKPYFKRIHKTL